MLKKFLSLIAFTILFAWVLTSFGAPGAAVAQSSDDLVERGAYLVKVAGCPSCHTPFKEEYNDPSKLTPDQIKVLAYNEEDAMDRTRLMSGGRVFDLGPAGYVISANLTSDPETGIGDWTDDQIKIAIRTGLNPSGRVLFPLMPYRSFNKMADEDLDAIVAYLRTLPPIKNEISDEGQVSTEGMQPLVMQVGVPAVDASDAMARGKYLVDVLMDRNSCHTPLDPATGEPRWDLYLGGGQPYEGPWGIVYGGNITPDEITGLGKWSETDMERAIITGVRPDGRRLAVMPWGAYANINNQDLDAVVQYLTQGVPSVSNEVPPASIAPGMEMQAPVPQEPAEETSPQSGLVVPLVIIAVLALVGIIAFFVLRGRKTSA